MGSRVTFIQSSITTLLTVLALQLTIGLAQASPPFKDTQDHWAHQHIDQLANAGFINGTGDGEFKPYDFINQETFLILIQAVRPEVHPHKLSTLSHFPSHPWKAEALHIDPQASKQSSSHKKEKSFQPKHQPRKITRAEALALTAEAAGLPLKNRHQTRSILQPFTDHASIPAWQKPYVASAIQQQWVHPIFPNKAVLHGQHYLRRGEAAFLINQLRTLDRERTQTVNIP